VQPDVVKALVICQHDNEVGALAWGKAGDAHA
jgi:hypothetical protein